MAALTQRVYGSDIKEQDDKNAKHFPLDLSQTLAIGTAAMLFGSPNWPPRRETPRGGVLADGPAKAPDLSEDASR